MTTSQGRDSRGGGRPQTRRFSGGRRRRQCVCKEVGQIDYKDVSVLRRFISDRGRIESGRKAGNCAKCQRELSHAISRARHLALLPYAPNHLRVTGSISPAASQDSSEEKSEDESPAAENGEKTAETTAEASSDEAEKTEATAETSEDSSDEEATEAETTSEASSEESENAEANVESSEDSSDEETPAETESSSDDSDSDESEKDPK